MEIPRGCIPSCGRARNRVEIILAPKRGLLPTRSLMRSEAMEEVESVPGKGNHSSGEQGGKQAWPAPGITLNPVWLECGLCGGSGRS